jgi:hypothetical protein
LSSSDPSAAQLLACFRNDCLSKSSDRHTSCPASPRARDEDRSSSAFHIAIVEGACAPTRHLAGSAIPTAPRASAASPAPRASAPAAGVSHICGTLSRGYYPFIRCLSQTLLCLAYLYLIKRSSKSISSYLFARILRLWKYRTFHVRCQAIAIRIFTLISAEYILYPRALPKRGAKKPAGSSPPVFNLLEESVPSVIATLTWPARHACVFDASARQEHQPCRPVIVYMSEWLIFDSPHIMPRLIHSVKSFFLRFRPQRLQILSTHFIILSNPCY